jgi:hypothetical protein
MGAVGKKESINKEVGEENHTQHKHPYIAATTIKKIQHQKQPTNLRSKIATNI